MKQGRSTSCRALWFAKYVVALHALEKPGRWSFENFPVTSSHCSNGWIAFGIRFNSYTGDLVAFRTPTKDHQVPCFGLPWDLYIAFSYLKVSSILAQYELQYWDQVSHFELLLTILARLEYSMHTQLVIDTASVSSWYRWNGRDIIRRWRRCCMVVWKNLSTRWRHPTAKGPRWPCRQVAGFRGECRIQVCIIVCFPWNTNI